MDDAAVRLGSHGVCLVRASPRGVHIPRADGGAGIGGSDVGIIDNQVFRSVVVAVHEINEEGIVVPHGQINAFCQMCRHVSTPLRLAEELRQGVERLPRPGLSLLRVGIERFPSHPDGIRRAGLIGGLAQGVVSERFVAHAPHAVAHELLQPQLFPIYFLRQAVEPPIASAYEQLHEASARAVHEGGLRGGMIGLLGEIEPNVRTDAVAHTRHIARHGIENPRIVRPHAEDGGVHVRAVVIKELHGIVLLLVFQRRPSAIPHQYAVCRRRAVRRSHGDVAAPELLGIEDIVVQTDDGQQRRLHVPRLSVALDVGWHSLGFGFICHADQQAQR